MSKDSNFKSFALGAATALGALGAYFLYGTKEGRERRAEIKGWMLKLKGEVLEELETLKDLNEETYHAVVDSVSKRYKALKHVDDNELEKVIQDLKGHWRDIKARFSK